MKAPLNLIETIKDRCHECYACVRNCPAKALQVKGGQAEVIKERCIHCGNCVRVCSQGAKKVRDSILTVKEMLNSEEKIIAGLAPSFPSFDPELDLETWISLLSKMGFEGVYEVAWGAQLIIKEYKKILQQQEGLIISSACPAVVNLIRKYYPELVDNIAPVVSPMRALERYIQQIEGAAAKVVMIGPCLAKKGEFDDVDSTEVLTFSEALELKEQFKIKDQIKEKQNKVKSKFKNNQLPEEAARKLPLAGGLIKAVTHQSDHYPDGYLKVEGRERVLELLNSIKHKEINPRFVDILFCEGCINGVDLVHENYFKKESAVYSFIRESAVLQDGQALYNSRRAEKVDLSFSFAEDSRELPQPDEDQIWEILNQTDKYKKEDLLNCGACGYNSCREKAVAVYQGLAELEMCLPYLLSEKRSEIKDVQDLNRELDTLINSSFDGMVMINREGRVERVNESYLRMVNISREQLLDEDISSLEEERIIYPSVSRLCIREKREITIIQNTASGQRLLTTGSPVLDENGEVIRIVVNARNLNELNQFNSNLGEEEKLMNYLEETPKIDLKDGPGHIISSSSVMQDILRLARKVGKTDSSVLIMGESGVGKEVIARYIHEQSLNRDKLIKINCAAIPESLLESELFGYETGAFSGAKRDGKPGLIEEADGGTLFLDEIGEMPVNMQAKLLQVLQEHRVTRIGGVEGIDVNFRLITATNQNLKKMVEDNSFREDLYYRLNVVPITIPPLRERREDIQALINYFLDMLNKKHNKNISFTDESLELLGSYNWPGNVRELKNLLERLIITVENDNIGAEHLKQFIDFAELDADRGIEVNGIIPLPKAVEEVEKKLLIMAQKEGRTTYQMAEMLGVNQSTVVRKLNKYFP